MQNMSVQGKRYLPQNIENRERRQITTGNVR